MEASGVHHRYGWAWWEKREEKHNTWASMQWRVQYWLTDKNIHFGQWSYIYKPLRRMEAMQKVWPHSSPKKHNKNPKECVCVWERERERERVELMSNEHAFFHMSEMILNCSTMWARTHVKNCYIYHLLSPLLDVSGYKQHYHGDSQFSV